MAEQMHASNVPRTTGKGGSFISVPYNSLLFFPSINFRTVATVSVCMQKKGKKLRGNRSTAGCTGVETLVYLQFCPVHGVSDDDHPRVISVAVSCHRKLPLPGPTTSLPTLRISLSADGDARESLDDSRRGQGRETMPPPCKGRK
ncbi:hypothetical protein J3F84DRAFT_384070 [Trichoderma pleuroticola]